MAVLFKRMALCGAGLIGGSLAWRARREGLVGRVIALGRGRENLELAQTRGLVDEITTDPAAAAEGSDLLMLAVPLRAMPEVAARMIPHLAPAAVISDVGSVKGWVVEQIEPLLAPEMALVAGHPVAGKESAGAAAADLRLFEGRRVILTPSSRSTPQAIERIERLWRAIGAQVERMEPGLHDRLLARASHLPQIVSSALGLALGEELVAGRYAAAYGAGGLRDTARLARSPGDIWRDICVTNREAILEALELYRGAFARLERAIRAGEPEALEQVFAAAQRIARHLAPGARTRPVIAIDGPVGAGKSTVARALAHRLGFTYLNTGAMYRAVAIAARREGLAREPFAEAALAELLGRIRIGFAGERIMLDGEDLSEAISEPAIGNLASALSALQPVRARMRELQRAAGADGGVVMEGRDIGTAVFPDAEIKFYLDAEVGVRAARRAAELRAQGHAIGEQEVRTQLIERDRRDSTRALAPLRCAPDAIVLDSSELTAAQVVARMAAQVERGSRSG